MSALNWHTSGTILVCILCISQKFFYLKMRILNFFKNTLFGFHSHAHFGECKFNCHVGFHLKEGSKSTELAGTFEHSLSCLHYASMVLPWRKMGTKWFVECFFLKWGIAAPIWELSILAPCSPTQPFGMVLADLELPPKMFHKSVLKTPVKNKQWKILFYWRLNG